MYIIALGGKGRGKKVGRLESEKVGKKVGSPRSELEEQKVRGQEGKKVRKRGHEIGNRIEERG